MGEIQQSSTMKIYLATALLLFVLHAATTANVETPENELVFDVAENDVMGEDTFAEEEEDVADSDFEDEEAEVAERRGRGRVCRNKCRRKRGSSRRSCFSRCYRG